MEVRNATIRSANLGVEDHGILSAMIMLDYGGSGQGFGGYALDSYDRKKEKRVGHAACATFVRGVLDTLEVGWWEKLPGTPCRAEIINGRIARIGHYLKDQWFDPSAAMGRGEA